tara:strand:- start:881 stop:1792 length:912 start_codon:yes stop_codon:yes gene_type:complete
MNILITGGSGYLGGILVKYLQQNHNIGLLTRRPISYFDNILEEIIIDFNNPTPVRLSHQYDLFIHIAGANEIDSQDYQTALNGSALSTRICIDICNKNNIQKFIYFSTFHVYGKSSGEILPSTPINCLNDYAITHFFAEEYVKMAKKQFDIDYIIFRLSNIYGAPIHAFIDRWEIVPNCFCKEAFETKQITLRSSGKQHRDFLSINQLLFTLKHYIQSFSNNANKIINCASGTSRTIFDIATITKQVYETRYNTKCTINVLSQHPTESAHLIIDNNDIQLIIPTSNNEFQTAINEIFCVLDSK